MRKMIIVFMFVSALLLMGCAEVQKAHTINSKPVQAEEKTEEPVRKTDPAPKVEKKVPPPSPEPEPEVEVEAEPEMTFEEEKAKAVERAEEIIKDMSGYKDQQGRFLKVLSAAKMGCEGCWLVEMSFTRDLLYYPEKEEFIKVNLRMKDWEMDSFTFE